MNLGDSDCGWGKRQESSSIGPRLVSFYREQGSDALLMGNWAWSNSFWTLVNWLFCIGIHSLGIHAIEDSLY